MGAWSAGLRPEYNSVSGPVVNSAESYSSTVNMCRLQPELWILGTEWAMSKQSNVHATQLCTFVWILSGSAESISDSAVCGLEPELCVLGKPRAMRARCGVNSGVHEHELS